MSKKNRNLIIAIVIIIPILLMFYADSKSNFVRQLQGPTESTDRVVTVGDRLFVISKENNIYTWQWKDLSIWPVAAKPQARVAVPIADDKIIYNPSTNLERLIVTNLKADKELTSLSLPYGAECKTIKTSQNGKFGIVSVNFKEGTQKGRFKLGLFDSEFKELSFVFQKDTSIDESVLYDFTVTNDGSFLAGAGGGNHAWLFVSDVKNETILWGKEFDKYSRFTRAGFSPDGKLLFIAEKIRHILAFDAATGQLLRTFVMDEYQTPANQKQNISCIVVSPNGKILAADTEPAGVVWFWDISTGQKIGQIPASNLTVSDIAFSPDSKYLATGCLVSPEIKIWKVPQLKP
ncbi:MAG: hypothetical protein KJ757_00485 [Planctomycetes bacterium]|nr:hypothetical protein [Planctomycetota bacterium]MBU1518345.1 hypothetical protein [Planctomycetota bacterium]MBU2458562.1 hypothetical protein [Planctomycetota bacterium]MBU2596032.1 hypothetical protein [Planctomycetota bacterium]